jgi:hypothetical protein
MGVGARARQHGQAGRRSVHRMLTLPRSPSNGHFLHRKWQTVSDLPFWIHRPFAFHSITSSARASSVSGTVRPSAFALTKSNFVGCRIGNSAGFVALRTRVLSTPPFFQGCCVLRISYLNALRKPLIASSADFRDHEEGAHQCLMLQAHQLEWQKRSLT